MDDKRGWPRRARVTAVYPADHSVDVQYFVDRGLSRRVPVMCGFPVSSRTGTVDLPAPSASEDAYTGLQDMTAIVDMIEESPVVIGFLHPRISQMLFDEQSRRIIRHTSDVYTSLDNDGNFEFSHPSGTFLRFGVTPDHEDLANQNHDQNWQIDRNTDKVIHFNLEVWNGGEMRAKIQITPDGDLIQEITGDIIQSVEGDVNQTIEGNANLVVGGNVDAVIEGAVTADVTGEVEVTTPKATVIGDAEVTGTVKMAGGGGMCVTTQSVCAFTGAPHPAGSADVDVGGG